MVAAARNAAFSVVTNQGVPRIFIGTAAGAATTQLLDLQTSNTIGVTLNGSVISAWSTEVNWAEVITEPFKVSPIVFDV